MIQVNEIKRVSETKYKNQYFVDRFDINTTIMLRKKFKKLKEEGIILSNFEDDLWTVSSYPKIQHSMSFILTTLIKKNLLRINITETEFIMSLKYFILLQFNKYSVLSIISNNRFIINLTNDSKCYKCLPNYFVDSNNVSLLENWLNWLSIDTTDFIDDLSALSISPKKGQARVLADFQTYFIVDTELRNYWKNAPLTVKTFFYPLYLFWIITTILPLRVIEFTVLPYNCLKKINGKCFLSIRRSNIKGKQNDYIYNNLNDFGIHTYEVPETIALEIKNYKTLLEKGGYSDFQVIEDRLISAQMMQDNYPNNIVVKLNPFFNTNHLRILKDRLMNDIFVDCLHYVLITHKEIEDEIKSGHVDAELGDSEISEWRCGDTRHLSMINLIMRGCSPMLIKEFAGHSTSDMSAHYYSNAYKMVKTNLFREKAARRIIDVPQSKWLPERHLGEYDTVNCPGGYCRSKNYILGSGIDCIKYKTCETCDYHIREKAITEKEDKWYTERIQHDFEKILKLVFTGKALNIKGIEKVVQSLIKKQAQYRNAIINVKEG